MARHGITNTPLACGHVFVAEVRPRAGERVWCWTCFDYRYVGYPPVPRKRQPVVTGTPSPRQVRLACGHIFHASPPPLPGDQVRCHACRAYRPA